MKKSFRSFTFEVKRSRLSSPKASTFQRYVAPPEPEAARRTPDASGLQITIALEVPPPPSPARILPSLLSERISTKEPDVPQATPCGMGVPEVVEGPEAPVENRPITSELIAPAGDLLPADRDEERNRSKPVRHRAKSPDNLSRSERWKRRLPKAAW